MTPPFTRLLGDTWTIGRREADLILRVGAPFLFLPLFAMPLLTDPLPAMPASMGDEAAASAWLDAVSRWGSEGNALAYLGAVLLQWFGLSALAVLLNDPQRPAVGEALAKTLRLYPRFALANLLTAIPVSAGLMLLVLPGLYLQGRLVALLPALAAEQPLSAGAAIGRSWRLTAGLGWAILTALVTLFVAQYLLVAPLVPADAWLRAPGHENPVVLAVVTAISAAAIALYQGATLVLGVAVYRRRISSGT